MIRCNRGCNMPYKDKKVAREKAMERMRKMRAKGEQGVTSWLLHPEAKGVTEKKGERGITPVVTPVKLHPSVTPVFGTPKEKRYSVYVGDCKPCRRCGAEYGHWSGYCDQPEKLVDCVSKVAFNPLTIPGVTRGMPAGSPLKGEGEPMKPGSLEMYRPGYHKVGDHVLMWKNRKLVEAIVPELDGEGQTIPRG